MRLRGHAAPEGSGARAEPPATPPRLIRRLRGRLPRVARQAVLLLPAFLSSLRGIARRVWASWVSEGRARRGLLHTSATLQAVLAAYAGRTVHTAMTIGPAPQRGRGPCWKLSAQLKKGTAPCAGAVSGAGLSARKGGVLRRGARRSAQDRPGCAVSGPRRFASVGAGRRRADRQPSEAVVAVVEGRPVQDRPRPRGSCQDGAL